MAVNILSLAEGLRPWHDAGLIHLLADTDASLQDAYTGADEEYSANLVQAASAPRARPSERVAAFPPPAATREEEATPATTSRQPSANQPETPRAQSSPPEASSAPSRSAADSGAATLVSTWPSAWQSVLGKTRPAPIVWTYPELGADLLGAGDPERSGCLRSLIGQLRLPKGSSAFWPLTLPDTASDRCFAQGLRILNPLIVVLLGKSAIAHTGLDTSLQTIFTQEISTGTMFVLLPGFDALVKDGEMVSRTVTFLRASFSGIPALRSLS